MSNILVYDGVLTDKNYAAMAAGSDPEPVEQPVATGDVTSHPTHTVHSTTTHYIGLPYQDHNYGAPPPPTPPESPSPVPLVSPLLPMINGLFDDPLKLEINVTASPEPIESKDEGVTRCICNFEHDDGYMICCDRCCVWQHVDCMGLERDSIPDSFYCERCQPREVNRQRAIALQSKKRAVLSDDSSSDSGEETPAVPMGSSATYTAISNSPTSLTLTTHNKHKKMKKKKKKRCKEDDKHHKKKKKRHGKKCNKSDEITAPMELDIMDESAMPAWKDSDETHDRYEEAICNQYSADIQYLITTHTKGQKSHSPSPHAFFGSVPRLAYPRVNIGRLGRNAASVGLVASDNLGRDDFIVEYWGKVMLKEQLEGDKTFFRRHYPYVLFYSKFNNVNICVDARSYGNVARFVRRSCTPNAEVQHYIENNSLHFCLFATVNIPKKTEVTIGFDVNYSESSYPVHCACSKKTCIVKRNVRKQTNRVTRASKNAIIGNHLADSSTSSLSVSSSLSKRRTVSPLRVSLAAHNAQNQAQVPTTNGDESSHHTPNNPPSSPARPTNSNTATQAEVPDGSEENHNEPKSAPVSAKKMTREERKMEAILQAIARLEKTEKRRKEAVGRTTGNKITGPAAVQSTGMAAETNTVTKAPAKQEEKPDGKENANEETDVSGGKDDAISTPEDVASIEVIAIDSAPETTPTSASAPTSSPSPVGAPSVATRTRTFKGRKRKGARRRSRVNSGASSVSVDLSSHDEESNPPTAPQSVNPPVAPSSQAQLLIQTVLSPSQTSDQQGMASPIPACSKHFKFPKTKKFFMNEWLNEKAQEASANKPLMIKTDPVDILQVSYSSPGTSFQPSKTGVSLNFGSRDAKMNLEASFGSAKKRWLRQAMIESNGLPSKAVGTNHSGTESPLCNGTLSPNTASYPISPALSPNTAVTNDLMTPLKKRMLRHSIAEERVATTPPLAVALQDKQHCQSTPTTPAVQDETHASSNADGIKSSTTDLLQKSEGQTEPVVSPESTQDSRRSLLYFPFPLPAKKDFRKSSSVDSGLSVTTPADFDRSPSTLFPGEHQEPDSSLAQEQGTPVKDEIHLRTDRRSQSLNLEDRTFETSRSDSGEVDSRRMSDSVVCGVPQRHRDCLGYGFTDANTDTVLPVNKQAVSSTLGADDRFATTESNHGASSHLDFSLSASQGSLASSLRSSHASLSDLHRSDPSLPDFDQSRTSLPDMSRSAELQISSVARKLDMISETYSTQRIPELPNHQGDAASQRIRRFSGCSSNRSSLDNDSPLPPRQSFAEDQIPGSIYSSFSSPLKRPSLHQSPERSGNISHTPVSGYDSSSPPTDQSKRRESCPSYLQPLDGPHAADSESPAATANARAPNWSQMPNSGPLISPGTPQFGAPSSVLESRRLENSDNARTVTGYMPSPVKLSEGHMGPGRPLIPGQPFGTAPSPVKTPLGPGLARPAGSPHVPGTPPIARTSPVPGTPPAAKKRVSLLEYRQRKGGDLPNTKKAKKDTPTSAPSTPTTSKPSLTPLKPPLPSPISTSKPNTPTKPLESPLKTTPGSASSTPTAQLPNLPLFAKTEKESGVGECLSLSTEAQQAISLLTTHFKNHKNEEEEEPSQDSKWNSNRIYTSDDDPLQKLRKEQKEKNRERERKEALSHKRPHSPDPPPPPPSKRPNPGLRLQIPPPPPPKTKADSRPGDLSGESTPVKMPNPGGSTTPVRTPGSGGIYPQQLGPSFSSQASSPYLPKGPPFQQQPYQAQQYPQPQPQQQQPPPPPQHQTGYNNPYPVYDYNHQKSHGGQPPFTQYHQGQAVPQHGQYPQQQHSYPTQQGFEPTEQPPPPPQRQQQPKQQQNFPKGTSKFGSNPNSGTKGTFGADARTSKPPFSSNPNSYSPRRGSFYQN